MEKHQNNVFSLPQGPEYGNPPRRTAESETGNTSWKSWDELPLSFDVETLAFVMGCKIGKARAICSKGELCCYKEGKRYIIFKQDLIEWLEQRRKNMKRAKSA